MIVRLQLPTERRSGGDRSQAPEHFFRSRARARSTVHPPARVTARGTVDSAGRGSCRTGVRNDPHGLPARLTSFHPQAVRNGPAQVALTGMLAGKPLDLATAPGAAQVHRAGSGPASGWIAGQVRPSGSTVRAGIGGRHAK